MIHYTKEYIQSLLDKFMGGTTTLEEEAILTSYFTQGRDVPREWEDYRLLFAELETMKPQTAHRHRWLWGTAAAAVVAGVLYVATPSQEPPQLQPQTALTAKADTADVVRPEPPNQEALSDSATLMRLYKIEERVSKKRKMRKPEPTMNDLAKSYALMAAAEQESLQVEQEMEQARRELIQAHLRAAGYTSFQQEDGTIIYTNVPTVYLTYEE